MYRMILSLCCMVFGLLMGIAIRTAYAKTEKGVPAIMPEWLVIIRTLGVYVLNPIAIVCAFWVQRLEDKLLILPLLCLLSFMIGGISALISSKILKHNGKKKGALFSVSSFANMGSFGSIVSYALFGEPGYAIASIYRMGEQIYYYGVGFPIANLLGNEKEGDLRKTIMTARIDNHIFIFIGAFAAGILLNLTGLPRPIFFDKIIAIIVPTSTLLIVLASGYTVNFGKVREYIKECICVALIKYAVIPLLMLPVFYAVGIQYMQDGLVLKVLIIMSCLPSALVALIPAQIYDLDYNLANSCWLFGTGLYFLVLPILIIILA